MVTGEVDNAKPADQCRSKNCVNPRKLGRSNCEKCLAMYRSAQRKRRARIVEAGLCIGCGVVPPAPERTRCQRCLDSAKDAARRFKRKQRTFERVHGTE